MILVYLDCSVALRTEVIRVLHRNERSPLEGAPLLDRVDLLDITHEKHTIAESIERHIKTLDALHLATALLIGERVTVATHDTAMKSAAQQLGLLLTDPVESN